jgi:hypothetical protein
MFSDPKVVQRTNPMFDITADMTEGIVVSDGPPGFWPSILELDLTITETHDLIDIEGKRRSSRLHPEQESSKLNSIILPLCYKTSLPHFLS